VSLLLGTLLKRAYRSFKDTGSRVAARDDGVASVALCRHRSSFPRTRWMARSDRQGRQGWTGMTCMDALMSIRAMQGGIDLVSLGLVLCRCESTLRSKPLGSVSRHGTTV